MHMPESRMLKHRQADKCNKMIERKIKRRDVEIAARCGKMEFSLEG